MIPTSSAPTEPVKGPDPIGRIWFFLTRPWVLLAVGGVALVFSVTAAFLPQLPGQLATDPVGASRWFLTTTNDYGSLGGTLRDLGLFDFLHSLPLRFLLAGLGLLLLLHTADLARQALRFRQLAQATAALPAQIGEALSSSALTGSSGRRMAVDLPPGAVADQVEAWLTGHFQHRQLLFSPLDSPTVPGPDGPVALQSDGDSLAERRILATANPRSAWVRLLLGVGLLVGLVALWLVVNLGWTVHLASLTPGDSFRYASQELSLTYLLPQGRPPAEFRVQIGEAQSQVLAITPATADQRVRLGTVQVTTQAGAPGLLIASNRPALALAGQNQLTQQVGLLFPSPGSEETVTLPEQEYVLRLVRLPAPSQAPTPAQPAFQVELFDSSSLVSGAPVQRLELRGSEGSSIFLDRGQLQLSFVPMPGLTVAVRSMPGLWLFWPALALIFVGSLGFLRRPSFLVAQIAPWPTDRTVLILQSDDPDALEALAVSVNEGINT